MKAFEPKQALTAVDKMKLSRSPDLEVTGSRYYYLQPYPNQDCETLSQSVGKGLVSSLSQGPLQQDSHRDQETEPAYLRTFHSLFYLVKL